MKKIVLFVLALTSFAALSQNAHSQSVYVRHTPYDVQIQIWNSQPREIYCTGPLTIHFMDGRRDTLYQSLWVRPRGSTNRTIRTPAMARIRYVNHSIWCR